MLAFLLCGVRGAGQVELYGFFAQLEKRTRLLRAVTSQTFSKARHQLRADVFERVNRTLLDLVGEEIGFPADTDLDCIAPSPTSSMPTSPRND